MDVANTCLQITWKCGRPAKPLFTDTSFAETHGRAGVWRNPFLPRHLVQMTYARVEVRSVKYRGRKNCREQTGCGAAGRCGTRPVPIPSQPSLSPADRSPPLLSGTLVAATCAAGQNGFPCQSMSIKWQKGRMVTNANPCLIKWHKGRMVTDANPCLIK